MAKALEHKAGIVNQVLPLEALAPHPSNYRSHPESQLQKLSASIARFGQVRSVVVQQGAPGRYLIVAGHGFLEAAQREGLTEVRADVIPADWSPEQVAGYLIADNLTAQQAEDDLASLAQLLQEQVNAGYHLESLGSSEEELNALLEELTQASLGSQGREADDPSGGGDDFDTEQEVETRCKVGDLWQLGRHRLLCGDSTKAEDVRRLMQGEKAVLMATDPPYGDSWVEKAKDMQAHGYVHSRAGLHGSIENDARTGDDLKGFLMAFLETAKLAGNAPMPFYVWHGAKRIIFEQALVDSGYFVHQPIVWVKPGFVIGRLHYHPRCEWALHGWRQGNGSCPFYGERNQSDVWEVARENDKIHPTQKPIALFAIPLENHTRPSEICYDPFAGSGTQVIAAERLERRCFAIELEPRYCDVILARWEAETGQEAKLLSRLAASEAG